MLMVSHLLWLVISARHHLPTALIHKILMVVRTGANSLVKSYF